MAQIIFFGDFGHANLWQGLLPLCCAILYARPLSGMRIFTSFTCFLFFFSRLVAQDIRSPDYSLQDSTQPFCNSYGQLPGDIPAYNKREPLIYPALKVLAQNITTWSITRFALSKGYSKVSLSSWEKNIKGSWEWDNDGIQSNFIGHPYEGALSFSCARSSGYDFYRSIPFSIGGSLLWEYFGENEKPSYNDIISTPLAGTFFGEIMYRIGSNVLDDRKHGTERTFREVLAALVDPPRGFSRLMQGRTRRQVNTQIYQQEPVDINISSGIHMVNDGTVFGTGHANAMFNVQYVYGDPFESRRRKPFDMFSLRADFSYSSARKPLDCITGYGLLAGRNPGQQDDNRLFLGTFEHFDYWNNEFFVMSAIGLGGGIISRMPIGAGTNLRSSLFASLVPLAGTSSRPGGDTAIFRDYNYSSGMELKMETTLDIRKELSISFAAYYYLVHAFYGYEGNNMVALLRPGFSLKVFNGLSVGMEELIFYNDNFPDPNDHVHVSTEQKIFARYAWEKIRK